MSKFTLQCYINSKVCKIYLHSKTKEDALTEARSMGLNFKFCWRIAKDGWNINEYIQPFTLYRIFNGKVITSTTGINKDSGVWKTSLDEAWRDYKILLERESRAKSKAEALLEEFKEELERFEARGLILRETQAVIELDGFVFERDI